MTKKIVAAVVSIAIVGGAVFGFLQRQLIYDHYIASTNELTSDARDIADRLQLTSKGELLFKASRSQVLPAQEFNRACRGVHEELSIVLGCYTSRRIYIYNIKDERLDGAKEVTAAHELLHAAYERLSLSERAEIDKLVEDEAKKLPDGKMKDTLELYEKATPSHLAHERYAIFGSEKADLSQKLEDHYAQFFTNRQVIVNLSEGYNEVFSSIEKRLKDYDSQLQKLMTEKSAQEKQLQTYRARLSQSESRLSSFNASGDIASYNLQVPIHNSIVSQHNSIITQLRIIVSDYNAIVEKRNDIAITQNDLVKQLDSNYKAAQ